MKKEYAIFVFLILTIFIAGCIPRQSQQGQFTTTSTYQEQQPGIYTLKVGDAVSISNKVVKVLKIDSSNGLVTLNVDGSTYEFEKSRLPKIARNLDIQTIRVDYGQTPAEHTVTLDIKLFEIKENEYYIRASERISVVGNSIVFDDLTRVEGVRLSVSNQQSNQDVIVDLGQTVNVFNLRITHKRAFNNPVKANRYALIEVKQV